jgi:hypothetical protein
MTPTHPRSLKLVARTALIAFGCSLALTLLPVSSAKASDMPAFKALDDKVPALPLTASFAKTEGEDGPYVLSLKNTSADSIKVSGKVLLSVFFHADSKSRTIPEHAVDAGQVWTVTGLAANDKVVLTAPGFAPLELTVP